MSEHRYLIVLDLVIEDEDPDRLKRIAQTVRDALDPPARRMFIVTGEPAQHIITLLHEQED